MIAGGNTQVCPECKLKCIKLVPPRDDGTGEKVCRYCKRKEVGNEIPDMG